MDPLRGLRHAGASPGRREGKHDELCVRAGARTEAGAVVLVGPRRRGFEETSGSRLARHVGGGARLRMTL
jgi:hypothetical protein